MLGFMSGFLNMLLECEQLHIDKNMVVQELNELYCFNQQTSCETFLENIPRVIVELSSDEVHF